MLNTASGRVLRAFVERIENIRAQKKELAEDEKLIFAELRAAGFSPRRMRDVLKRRAAPPRDLQEAEAELDMYLAALGMKSEAPLFRAVGLMKVDTTVREQVIEAFKLLVPHNGEVVVKIAGQAVRLTRDEHGVAKAEDVVERPARDETAPRSREKAKPNAPECTADEAEELGREAARTNQPVIANPFPFGDPRRARFDAGWRKEMGNDGMGPDED